MIEIGSSLSERFGGFAAAGFDRGDFEELRVIAQRFKIAVGRKIGDGNAHFDRFFEQVERLRYEPGIGGADAIDAMSSTRPYRRGLSPFRIDEIFRRGAGIQWDPRVFEALFSRREDVDRITRKGLGESLKQVVDETPGRNRS